MVGMKHRDPYDQQEPEAPDTEARDLMREQMSTERGRGKLVKLSPSDHIDGTAALLDAMCVRQKWDAEIGDQLRA